MKPLIDILLPKQFYDKKKYKTYRPLEVIAYLEQANREEELYVLENPDLVKNSTKIRPGVYIIDIVLSLYNQLNTELEDEIKSLSNLKVPPTLQNYLAIRIMSCATIEGYFLGELKDLIDESIDESKKTSRKYPENHYKTLIDRLNIPSKERDFNTLKILLKDMESFKNPK